VDPRVACRPEVEVAAFGWQPARLVPPVEIRDYRRSGQRLGTDRVPLCVRRFGRSGGPSTSSP
jgi:hypothetical protein